MRVNERSIKNNHKKKVFLLYHNFVPGKEIYYFYSLYCIMNL